MTGRPVYTNVLSEAHAAKLAASGVTAEVAEARGYATIEDPNDVRLAAFAPAQRNVPLLYIPCYDVHGNRLPGQIRPDTPRVLKGRDGSKPRTLKYESAKGSGSFLDVNPLVRERLVSTFEPIVITEGPVHGDSAVAHDIVCAAVPGVFSWRGRKDSVDVSTAIAAFEAIPMAERQVVIAYDHDVTTKDTVRSALRRLVRYLRTFHADLYIAVLPALNGDTGTGLDDYLAAGHTKADLMDLARPADDVLKELDHETAARNVPARTDLGNAKRLLAAYGERLAYCPKTGWYAYNGLVWEREAEHVVYGYALTLADLIRDEVLTLRRLGVDDEEIGKFESWRHWSQMESKVRASVFLLSKDPAVQGSWNDFDRNKYLLAVGNGTLALNADGSATLRESNPDDLLTLATPTPYDPAAECPVFEAVLERVLPDPEVRDYVHRLAGAALIGANAGQRVNIWYGSGANGKSTVLYAWKAALGSDLAVEVDPRSLQTNGRTGSAPTPDLMRLRGARLVMATEAAERLDTELLKRLSGGEDIVARQLHGKTIAFEPAFDMVLSCNNRPDFTDRSEGLWRRVVVVPFEVTIPAEERRDQDDLHADLDAEAPGILRWMVEGYQAFRKAGGLKPPEKILIESRSMRDATDWLQEFFNAQGYGPVEGGFLRQNDVWHAFQAHRVGDPSLKTTTRSALVAEVERKIGPRVRDEFKGFGWRGYGIVPPPDRPDDSKTTSGGPLGPTSLGRHPSPAPSPETVRNVRPDPLTEALSGDQFGWLRESLPAPRPIPCDDCGQPMRLLHPYRWVCPACDPESDR